MRAELALRGIRRWHELNLTLERWPVGSARPPWLTTRNREKPAAPGSVADPMKLVMTVGRSTDHELLAANVTFTSRLVSIISSPPTRKTSKRYVS